MYALLVTLRYVDRSMMARQPVSHRRLSLSPVLIYVVLNRQSSGRSGQANCFDRLPLPTTFETVDDYLVYFALVTRLFFPGPTNVLTCIHHRSVNCREDLVKEDEKLRENINGEINAALATRLFNFTTFDCSRNITLLTEIRMSYHVKLTPTYVHRKNVLQILHDIRILFPLHFPSFYLFRAINLIHF